MLENHFLHISDKLRLAFYKRVFSVVREREGSLSAMEVFSLEVIYLLGAPTVSEFADFIGISRSAASYKVAMLMQKGYITKEASENDKREFKLVLTEKYLKYVKLYEERHELYENVSDFAVDLNEDSGHCVKNISEMLDSIDYYSFRK